MKGDKVVSSVAAAGDGHVADLLDDDADVEDEEASSSTSSEVRGVQYSILFITS